MSVLRRAAGALAHLRDRALRRRTPFEPLMHALGANIAPVLERHPGIAAAWKTGATVDPPMAHHEEAGAFFDDVTSSVAAALASGIRDAGRRGDYGTAAEQLLSALLLLVAQGPHLYSLFSQNRDSALLDAVRGADTASMRAPRVMLFTDTLDEVNGVSRFLSGLRAHAAATGRKLEVVCCGAEGVEDVGVRRFAPMWSMPMPGYEGLNLNLPPVVRMLRWVHTQSPSVIHVSTPGPVGLVGLAAARMLRVPVVATYHTDFPKYAERLFDDAGMGHAAAAYMRWFHGRAERVIARSAESARALDELGIRGERVTVLPARVDTGLFNPAKRDPGVWARLAASTPALAGLTRRSVKVLCVGRVSVEKNLAMLARAWKGVQARIGTAHPADLVVVGDGPFRAELEKQLRGARAHFLGVRCGEELAAIYASADMLVFPSDTDTLGQVAMEAMASGVPVLAWSGGAAGSMVEESRGGVGVPDLMPRAWEEAIIALIGSEDQRREMGHAGAEWMKERGDGDMFERFWREHRMVNVSESPARKAGEVPHRSR